MKIVSSFQFVTFSSLHPVHLVLSLLVVLELFFPSVSLYKPLISPLALSIKASNWLCFSVLLCFFPLLSGFFLSVWVSHSYMAFSVHWCSTQQLKTGGVLPVFGDECLPQSKEYENLGVLFMNDKRMEQAMDWQIRATFTVMTPFLCSVVVKNEVSRKTP